MSLWQVWRHLLDRLLTVWTSNHACCKYMLIILKLPYGSCGRGFNNQTTMSRQWVFFKINSTLFIYHPGWFFLCDMHCYILYLKKYRLFLFKRRKSTCRITLTTFFLHENDEVNVYSYGFSLVFDEKYI